MHETQVHLPQGQRCAITQPGDAADGQCQGVADYLGSTQRQAAGGQALSQPGQTLWRKRRGQGKAVHERDTQE